MLKCRRPLCRVKTLLLMYGLFSRKSGHTAMKPFLRTSNSQWEARKSQCCALSPSKSYASLTVNLFGPYGFQASADCNCKCACRPKTTASGPPKMTQVLSRDTPPACRKTACAGQCAHQTCQQTLAVSHRYQMVPKIMARQHLHGRNSSIFLHTFVDVALIYLNALHGLIQ